MLLGELQIYLSYYIENQLLNLTIIWDVILRLMMMLKNKKKQEWSQEEINLLQTLYPQFTSKKWKRIVEEFRKKGFSRSEIDCREKWINFVDPAINKAEWQQWQLRRMYEIHSQFGTRWCLIQKQIGRTQNMIKNKFYGTLRNFIRFILNYFGKGHSCLNYQITKLSPKFLNEMYNSQNAFFCLNGEVKNAIFEMGFRVDRKIMTQRVKSNKPLYTKLYQFLLNAFQSLNQPYNPEPARADPISDHHHPDGREKLEDAISHYELLQQPRPHYVKKQEFVSEEAELPENDQKLQNVYINQDYQNLLMTPYHQYNPTVVYYVLSYL